MSDFGGLHLCSNCHDAYTTGDLCTSCAHQAMIDHAESGSTDYHAPNPPHEMHLCPGCLEVYTFNELCEACTWTQGQLERERAAAVVSAPPPDPTYDPIAMTMALRERYATHWRDKPEAYWLDRIHQEVSELHLTLDGQHSGPVDLELSQIASIRFNWLEMRNSTSVTTAAVAERPANMPSDSVNYHTPSATSPHYLIGAFMNLVDACRRKNVEFTPEDGFSLQDCEDTISEYLRRLGYTTAQIADFWSGEAQLTSS